MDNPAAFPHKATRNTSSDPLATPRKYLEPGLTMRDYFAGQALAGLMASDGHGDDRAPTYAYWLADAMLAARSPSSEGGQSDAS